MSGRRRRPPWWWARENHLTRGRKSCSVLLRAELRAVHRVLLETWETRWLWGPPCFGVLSAPVNARLTVSQGPRWLPLLPPPSKQQNVTRPSGRRLFPSGDHAPMSGPQAPAWSPLLAR